MARTYRPIETEDDVPRPKPSYVSTLTIESWFYHIFSAGFLIHMIATTISFSSSTRPEFPNYKRFLRQSWIPNTLFDNSDVQYRGFRAGLLFLIPVSLIHVSLSNALQRWTTTHQSRIHPRIAFSLLFSILYFIVYNGLSGFLKILTVLVLSYTVVKNVAGYKWGPGIVWALGLGMLIGTKHFRGFEFGWISPHLGVLDQLGYGVIQDWWDPLRFCFLRIVSFGMDLHWREQESEASERLAVANHTESCKECDGGGFQCYKSRVQIHRPMKDYNFIAYLCYLLYAPLYLAGPIMTFNDFMSQTKTRLPSTTNHSQLIRYTLRLILCVVLMETFQHWLFVIAIAKSGTWLSSFTGFEVFCLVVFNLKHIWLKLLIMWRFFRLWALLDGYESVENMGRCMMNNQSASGFWRNWHRSFNRWIVRYVYVPLGGSRLYVLNLLVTFTFVALWHDLEMKLITWGWFICLSIIPEYLAGIYFPHKKWESWRFYQSLCACGAVVNIWLMVCANIVGFGALSGDDGGFLKGIPKMFSSDIMSIMGMFVFWFSVAQVGFSYRRWEEMTEKSTE